MQKKHHHDHLAMQTFYFWLYIFFRFFSSFDLYNVWHRQKEKTHTVETEKIVLFWQKHTHRGNRSLFLVFVVFYILFYIFFYFFYTIQFIIIIINLYTTIKSLLKCVYVIGLKNHHHYPLMFM